MAKDKTEDSAALIKRIFNADEVITPAEYWRRLIGKSASADKAQSQSPPQVLHPDDDAKAAHTRQFLVEAMKADPDNTSRKIREDFENECYGRFEIGTRAFDHIWRDTATAVYKKPGPRRKRRS